MKTEKPDMKNYPEFNSLYEILEKEIHLNDDKNVTIYLSKAKKEQINMLFMSGIKRIQNIEKDLKNQITNLSEYAEQATSKAFDILKNFR